LRTFAGLKNLPGEQPLVLNRKFSGLEWLLALMEEV